MELLQTKEQKTELRKQKNRDNMRAWRYKNPEGHRRHTWNLRGTPKATRPCPELCEACNNSEIKLGKSGKLKSLCLDHCHETKQFRGWLCATCNLQAGKSREKMNTAASHIVIYLKNFYDNLEVEALEFKTI